VQAATFNGAVLPTFGTAASADVTTGPADTVSGRVWRTNDMVKQSSATDATSGRVMGVGAFGIGTQYVITDFNLFNPSGFGAGIADSIALNAPLPGFSWAVTCESGVQEATELWSDPPQKFTRVLGLDSIWKAWVRIPTTNSTPSFINVKDKYTNKGSVTGSVTIDPTVDGGDVEFTMTGNTAVTFTTSGIAANESAVLTVQVNGAFAVTWPAGIFWPNGQIPNYSSGTIYTFQMRNKAGTMQIFGDSYASGGGIGYGQTWQNVTGSRAANTTYTNSTGKPIEVWVSFTVVSGGIISYLINGVQMARNAAIDIGDSIPVGFIVPNGATYRCDTTSTLFQWSELR